jgi:hypothetical protein
MDVYEREIILSSFSPLSMNDAYHSLLEMGLPLAS